MNVLILKGKCHVVFCFSKNSRDFFNKNCKCTRVSEFEVVTGRDGVGGEYQCGRGKGGEHIDQKFLVWGEGGNGGGGCGD